jgi:hypothetical protein
VAALLLCWRATLLGSDGGRHYQIFCFLLI